MIAAADDASPHRRGVLSAVRTPLLTVVPEDPAVRIAFTSRHAPSANATANLSSRVGGGDVAAARAEALALVGCEPADAVFMEQVHGAAVADVDRRHAGRGAFPHTEPVRGVDALVTTVPDLALTALVADCVPVVLVDPGRGVAVVHAGRRGLARGVVGAALARLAPDGAGRVVAIVGPAIGGCCYEVTDDVARELVGDWPQAQATTTWGTPSLDLPATARAQLAAAGVGRVESVGSCTRCDHATWFSHRAVALGADPGRQAAIVVRTSTGRAPPAGAATGPSLESR